MNRKNLNFFNKINNFFRKKRQIKKDPSKKTKILKKNNPGLTTSSFKTTIAKSNGMYFFNKLCSLFRKKKVTKKESVPSNKTKIIKPKQVTLTPLVKESITVSKANNQTTKALKKTERKNKTKNKKNRQNKKNKQKQPTTNPVTPIQINPASDPITPIPAYLIPDDSVAPKPTDPAPEITLELPSQIKDVSVTPIPTDPTPEISLESPAQIKDDSVTPIPKDPAPEISLELPAQIKIVITGSVGAGKTTAIFSVSDKEPVTTESPPTDDVKKLKNSTTTSMDYGSYKKLDSKVHVYGTPGQKRFSFMSEVLTKGAGGLIILISNNQEDPVTELEYYLNNNAEFLTKNPAVIGITHLDENDEHMSIYSDFMKKSKLKWPVIPVDARKKTDVFGLIDKVIQAKFG